MSYANKSPRLEGILVASVFHIFSLSFFLPFFFIACVCVISLRHDAESDHSRHDESAHVGRLCVIYARNV